MPEVSSETKHRVKVRVVARPIPGADTDKDGKAPVFTGYGCAGRFWPNGETEAELTTQELERLRAETAPVDSRGRPQNVPVVFMELGPVQPQPAPQPAPVLSPTPSQPNQHSESKRK